MTNFRNSLTIAVLLAGIASASAQITPPLGTLSSHMMSTGTAPALSACGTTPSIVGTDTKGAITVGTGVVTACTATFATAYATAPVCVANSNTAGAFVAITTATITTITFGTSTAIGGGIIYYHCMQ